MLYDGDGNFAGGMCDGGQGSVHLAEIMVKRTVSVPCISVALLVVLLLCCSFAILLLCVALRCCPALIILFPRKMQCAPSKSATGTSAKRPSDATVASTNKPSKVRLVRLIGAGLQSRIIRIRVGFS